MKLILETPQEELAIRQRSVSIDELQNLISIHNLDSDIGIMVEQSLV